MSTSSTLKGFTAATASALLVMGGAGIANAQNTVTVVPGDNGDGRTVVVNNAGMDVDVVSVDRTAGTVDVTMTNNLGFTVYCEAPNADTAPGARPGGTVSTAPVAEMSAEYYERFQNVKAEELSIQNGSVTMNFWPLGQLLPQGSLANLASESVQLRSQITEANTKAKVDGLYGTTGAFQLTDGATVSRTITLGPPATNPRGADKVGYFTMCAQGTNSAAAQGTGQLYAWSAFEEGWPPADEGNGNSGSLGSGSLGSLGSSGPADDSGAGDGNGDGGDGGGGEG
ncbi:hypothetical protein [Dietzia alimentaria]|uniref:hypothetical protein n=1 Tax=Dietzia alimentaria TaxID=665550 RepID=UPI00029A9871|nr:hypothetical protein [Dietzia alimentaria]